MVVRLSQRSSEAESPKTKPRSLMLRGPEEDNAVASQRS